MRSCPEGEGVVVVVGLIEVMDLDKREKYEQVMFMYNPDTLRDKEEPPC